MKKTSFTRDEVILALDVLYSSTDDHLSEKSNSIIDLCNLLQRLPIHSTKNRRAIFRNESGVIKQLYLFKNSWRRGEKHVNVGEMFYTVAMEFENDHEQLHEIADAIRDNEDYYGEEFGASLENISFQEGALLEHLHRTIEARDRKKVSLEKRCFICQITPEILYQPCGYLLENHLIVNPVNTIGSKNYNDNDYITVCPNCHAALHKFRPWLGKDNCERLLRS